MRGGRRRRRKRGRKVKVKERKKKKTPRDLLTSSNKLVMVKCIRLINLIYVDIVLFVYKRIVWKEVPGRVRMLVLCHKDIEENCS